MRDLSLCQTLSPYRPQEIAIERVFFQSQTRQRVELGQARGPIAVRECNAKLEYDSANQAAVVARQRRKGAFSYEKSILRSGRCGRRRDASRPVSMHCGSVRLGTTALSGDGFLKALAVKATADVDGRRERRRL